MTTLDETVLEGPARQRSDPVDPGGSLGMAAWVLHLTDSIKEGVGSARTHVATLAEHAHLLHDLDDERLERRPGRLRQTARASVAEHAAAVLGLLLPRKDCAPAAGNAEPVDVDAIVEEAMRLGCGDAPQW